MKFTEADIDWQHAHGVTSAELSKAKAEIDRLRAVLEKIKGGHSEDPQLDAIRALGQEPPR